MSYKALYRKWRPLVFEDVVEQEHVVKTLRNAVNMQRIAHAYLFCGTRGTGKTTMAKIFSRAINCLNPKDGDPCNECEICKGVLDDNILDVVEIDAASNNSVDNVREIRDEVIYAPSQAKYKVYIIDEVHMLSIGAFNALLKTLEEPPSHVVFILATTDPHKLPATILSRCQRFDFRRITVESIAARITNIAAASGADLESDSARLIARLADGALRDAISILDQCLATGGKKIAYEDVLAVVGIVNDDFVGDIVDALAAKDVDMLLKQVERMVMDGKNLVQFVWDLVSYFRNILICKISAKPEAIIEASPMLLERLRKQSSAFSQEKLVSIIKELSGLESGLKWASQPRILLEVSFIKLCNSDVAAAGEDLAERLAAVEEKLAKGNFTVNPSVSRSGSESIPKGENTSRADRPVNQGTQKAPPADAVKVPVGNAKTLNGWDIIVNELKNSGRMAIYSNLLSARAVELGGNLIAVVFPDENGFNKMFVSKVENLETVQKAVGSYLGREVHIKCMNESELNSSHQTMSSKAEEKDELVEKAKELAGRLNIPVNVIDE